MLEESGVDDMDDFDTGDEANDEVEAEAQGDKTKGPATVTGKAGVKQKSKNRKQRNKQN